MHLKEKKFWKKNNHYGDAAKKFAFQILGAPSGTWANEQMN